MADMASGTRLLSELSSGFGSSLSSELDRWEFFVLYLQYGIVFTLFLAAAGVLLYKMSWNLQLAYTLAAKLLRRGGAPSAEKPSTKRVRSLAACAFMLQLVGCRACGRGCVGGTRFGAHRCAALSSHTWRAGQRHLALCPAVATGVLPAHCHAGCMGQCG